MNADLTEQAHTRAVPWSAYEAWLGVALLGLGTVAFLALQVLLYFLEISPNSGLLIGLMELMLLAPVWWLALHRHRVGWEMLGLRGFEAGAVGLGCGLMIASFGFNFFYASFLDIFNLRIQEDMSPVFAETSYPWLLLAVGVVLAPVVEEIAFRGFVFAGLRQKYGWKKAALVSAAIFAAFHLSLTALLPVFVLGYIFAYLYQQSNSIWPAILMHVLTNALSLGMAYLAAQV
jgi:membrane protease YdiL (CAAX protease family)